MIKTKITRIGNSKGVVIPRVVVQSLALDYGDEVQLEYNEPSQTLILTFPHTKQLKLSNIV